jgi:hypothetical protein
MKEEEREEEDMKTVLTRSIENFTSFNNSNYRQL